MGVNNVGAWKKLIIIGYMTYMSTEYEHKKKTLCFD